jgi:hypothetical protein
VGCIPSFVDFPHNLERLTLSLEDHPRIMKASPEGMETHPRADEAPLEPWRLVFEKWRLLEATLCICCELFQKP